MAMLPRGRNLSKTCGGCRQITAAGSEGARSADRAQIGGLVRQKLSNRPWHNHQREDSGAALGSRTGGQPDRGRCEGVDAVHGSHQAGERWANCKYIDQRVWTADRDWRARPYAGGLGGPRPVSARGSDLPPFRLLVQLVSHIESSTLVPPCRSAY